MKLYANARIVVPVDFSEEADQALAIAIEIAATSQQIIAVHVAPLISAFEPGVVYAASDTLRRENLLSVMQHRYADAKFEDIGFEILFGDPGHEIVDFALRTEAGLIVMPSHGRTGRERILLGSVAERVVRLAHCPVLVLRR
jgi:nucleotide-binding universal stress UspA family protein